MMNVINTGNQPISYGGASMMNATESGSIFSPDYDINASDPVHDFFSKSLNPQELSARDQIGKNQEILSHMEKVKKNTYYLNDRNLLFFIIFRFLILIGRFGEKKFRLRVH